MGDILSFKHLVTLDKIEIQMKNGVNVDLSDVLSQFEIYQSISQPFIFCEVIFNDPQDIEEKGNFQGDETLIISAHNTADPDQKIDLEFECYSRPGLNFITTLNNQKMITLRFFTKGWKKFYYKKVSTFYEKETVPDVVKKHLSEHYDIDIDKLTPGFPDDKPELIVLPRWNALTTVKYLRKKCKSDTNGAFGQSIPEDPGYTFFENTDGHHFVTISDLISQPITDDQKLWLIMDKQNPEFNVDTVQNFNILNHINLMKNYISHQFGSKITYYDLQEGTLESQSYELSDYYNNTYSVGKWMLWNKELYYPELDSDWEKYTQTHKLPSFTDVKESGVYDFLWNQRMNLLGQNRLEVMTALNLRRKVGDMINFSIRGFSGESHKTISGNYLITDMIHLFSLDKQSFQTKYTLAKDSYNLMESETKEITDFVNKL